MLVLLRWYTRYAVEGWSRVVFRRGQGSTGPTPAWPPATDRYRHEAIPAQLRASAPVPRGSRLSWWYFLPYYGVLATALALARRFPLRRDRPWDPQHWTNRVFPRSPEGWGDLLDDGEFTRLRVEGPNLFLLRYVADGDCFVCDLGPPFEGALEPVTLRFVLDGEQLVPHSIVIAGTPHRPGEPGWRQAKGLANAIDARYCAFAKHLGEVHLTVGQGFALSKFRLPDGHRLRRFLDAHTHGTLVINDLAYRLLISPTSYFVTSGFASMDEAFSMLRAGLRTFRFESLIVPTDLDERQVERIPGNPYPPRARAIWAGMEAYAREVVDLTWPDDAAMAADAALLAWLGGLRELIPGVPPDADRAAIARLLSVLLYNNVVHEVIGDMTAFFSHRAPDNLRFIRMAAARDPAQAPTLAEVYLMDQGVYAGAFQNNGNLWMSPEAPGWLNDDALADAARRFQAAMATLEARFAAEDDARGRPFLRIRPSRWKASVSF